VLLFQLKALAQVMCVQKTFQTEKRSRPLCNAYSSYLINANSGCDVCFLYTQGGSVQLKLPAAADGGVRTHPPSSSITMGDTRPLKKNPHLL